MNFALYRSIRDYLEGHQTLTLAACDQDVPWAAALFFASDAQLNLYFVSSRDTRHATLLTHNPRVAATVTEDYRDWRLIQGVQLEGRAELLRGAARDLARDVYLEKFPFAGPAQETAQTAEPELWQVLQGLDFFRITPERILFTDNRRGFGHREELVMQVLP